MIRYNIETIPSDDIGRLAPLIKASSQVPYRFLAHGMGDELNRFWFDSIVELVQTRNSLVLSALDQDSIVACLVYTDNPWETNVLGIKAGVINQLIVSETCPFGRQVVGELLDALFRWALSSGVQFLVCKPYTDSVEVIQACERKGFLLVDALLDCIYDYRQFPIQEAKAPQIPKGVTMRLATSSDLDELIMLAGASFQSHFGRYHSDEKIGRGSATRIYEEWIRSSLNGYADWICLAEIDGRIAGYSIWKKPSPLEQRLSVRVGHYSIAGIHPNFFGRGLFTALTYEGMKLLEGIADIVEGPTHINNYGVQLGYSKLHWRVCCDARYSFHKWL
jgi:hypothetical protein